MVKASFQANDFMVGIKDGKLFFSGAYRCSHGTMVDQVTVWLPLELKDKFYDIKNLDGIDYDSVLDSSNN